MKFIYFDVANTLLHKPELWGKLLKSISKHSDFNDIKLVKQNHKLLSESIKFPDKTSKVFYRSFNAELLYSLGIIPTEVLLDDIFNNCTYLDWAPFEDISYLSEITCSTGVISNWDNTLKNKLQSFIDINF